MAIPGLGDPYKRTDPDSASRTQFDWNLRAALESGLLNQPDFFSREGRTRFFGTPGKDQQLFAELSPEQEAIERRRAALGTAGLDYMLRNLMPQMQTEFQNSLRTLDDLGNVQWQPGAYTPGKFDVTSGEYTAGAYADPFANVGPSAEERAMQQQKLAQFAQQHDDFWGKADQQYADQYYGPAPGAVPPPGTTPTAGGGTPTGEMPQAGAPQEVSFDWIQDWYSANSPRKLQDFPRLAKEHGLDTTQPIPADDFRMAAREGFSGMSPRSRTALANLLRDWGTFSGRQEREQGRPPTAGVRPPGGRPPRYSLADRLSMG